MTNDSGRISELIIEPERTERNYWRDVWSYREVFYTLALRDLQVRYRQTAIGVAWALIRPLLTMLVFSVVFGRLAHFETPHGIPYTLVVFAGLLPWQFFSAALADSGESLVRNSNLITKIYFPRIIIPITSIIVSLVDSAISFGLLAAMMAYYRFVPPPQIVLMPAFVLLAFLLASGLGLFVTSLSVKYRDFRYIVPFLLQVGIYITPVGYSSIVVTERYSERARFWFSLNPMVGIVDGFRWCLNGELLYVPGLLLSVGLVIVSLWIGVRLFRRTERSFADNI
jgi:lipopolysaccharide transport system permease protein